MHCAQVQRDAFTISTTSARRNWLNTANQTRIRCTLLPLAEIYTRCKYSPKILWSTLVRALIILFPENIGFIFYILWLFNTPYYYYWGNSGIAIFFQFSVRRQIILFIGEWGTNLPILDETESSEQTPLFYAVGADNSVVIERLVRDFKANMNATAWDNSLFSEAALGHLLALQQLVALGCHPGDSLDNPMWTAARLGYYDCLEFLLKNKQKLNLPSDPDTLRRVMFSTLKNKYNKCLEVLLDHVSIYITLGIWDLIIPII